MGSVVTNGMQDKSCIFYKRYQCTYVFTLIRLFSQPLVIRIGTRSRKNMEIYFKHAIGKTVLKITLSKQ